MNFASFYVTGYPVPAERNFKEEGVRTWCGIASRAINYICKFVVLFNGIPLPIVQYLVVNKFKGMRKKPIVV
jgi:hypothetical protein